MSSHDLITANQRRVDRIRPRARSAWLAPGAITLALTAAAALGPTAALAGSPIRVTLACRNHQPVVGKKWVYSVTVTSASGRRLSGTETTQYLYGGEVVGTEKPANVHFSNGYYRDTLKFPGDATGYNLTLRVVVHTKDGTGWADWWIKVRS